MPERDDDPPPIPPARPQEEDCCHGGCDRCVYDLYDEARDRYEAALRAWEARRRARTTGAS
jgi:Oxidoreductase-like protein, N-terminal